MTRILIVGSGAGGAVTALTLAERGFEVLLLEEGSRYGVEEYGRPATQAMRRFYRRRGMSPILGSVPIGYVEGCCVGGSTEINSGFWHRAPREVLLGWQARYGLEEASESDLAPHYEWAETQLGVTLAHGAWPRSTQLFARGIEKMGWSYQEVPRAAPGCRNTNACAHGCPTGAKQGMSVSLLPKAETAGARVVPDCRVHQLLRRQGRVTGAVATLSGADGMEHLVRFDADFIFVCCGPTETPALLHRSGIRYHVGNTLRTHPYLKLVARFSEVVDAADSVLPLLQVREFWPEISMGGAFFTPGHLAMTLSENWPQLAGRMQDQRRMAMYYVGVKGSGQGSVRPTLLGRDATLIRYELSDVDCRQLSAGLARLSSILLAAGAEEVYPSVFGLPVIRTAAESARWLDDTLPRSALSLTTVHAFSSCPIGERQDRCAADSYGKVYGYANLFINDASMLPDSPGVNPQGTVMAMAQRNAIHFAQRG